MNAFEQLKDAVLAELLSEPSHRIKARNLEKRLVNKYGASGFTVREAVKDLVMDGELVYAFRDPYDYVEIAPAEPHHAARPMKVVLDSHGDPWICDADALPTEKMGGQSCWPCGDMAFTRDD